MVRYVYSVLLMSGIFFSAHASGIVMNYDLKINQSGKNMSGQMQVYYQNGKTRMEMNFKNMPMGNMVHLTDIKNSVAYTLFPEKKSYMENKIGKISDYKKDESFKSTKKTKTIAGYSCEVYEKKNKKQTDSVCLSKDLYKKYKSMMASFYTDKNNSFMPKGVDGFPLEFESKQGDKIETKVSVTSIKEKSVKSSMFGVPKGYKKMNVMPMGGKDMKDMKKTMMDAMKNGGMDAKKIEEMKKMAEEMQKQYQSQ